MLCVLLIVDFADVDVVVPLYRRANSYQSTLVWRDRLASQNFVGNVHGDFAVLIGTDAIVVEWRPKRARHPGVAGRGGKRSPIARKHGRRGNELLHVCGTLPKFRRLESREKEYFGGGWER